MGTKYLGILIPIVLGFLLLKEQATRKQIPKLAGWTFLVGGFWYMKNLVLMHNPVYPFLYSLFRSSRWWSADRAVAYQSEQQSFGYQHSLVNLLQFPLQLMTHPDKYANPGDLTSSVLVGGLVIGLFIAGLTLRKRDEAVSSISFVGSVLMLIWFFNAQIGRYLISVAPLLCVPAGVAAYWDRAFAPGNTRP